ncbi:F-box/WD repeat-containing protein pof1-like [Miscanthus floridulus]|uniref:F-box/WD repeat-containing protein pof1-like n=1 Tax=Miscanthus floridulus TaxID=154761 RepID=UPI003458DFC4
MLLRPLYAWPVSQLYSVLSAREKQSASPTPPKPQTQPPPQTHTQQQYQQAPPPPQQPQPKQAAVAGAGAGAGARAAARAAGRVLGRPMEDVRATYTSGRELSFSSTSFASFSSSSSSSTTFASSSPHSAFPPPAAMPPPQPQGPCKALAVLRDHVGSVSSLSLCGEFLLSASTGGDIVAWQQPDLRRFARFGHGENGGSVKALAAAGGRVFFAHQDGRIRVWRVSRRSRSQNVFKLVAALPTARDYLGRVFRQTSYVQTTARRSHRRLWIEHADSISCLAVAATVHNAALLYSGSWDRTLKVWRIADRKCLEYIRAHDDAVNAVAAGSGSADGRVKAWEKGKASHFLQGVLIARDGVFWNALAVAASDHRVYAAGSDGHVAGWDRRALDPRVRCEGARHASAVPLRRQGPALHLAPPTRPSAFGAGRAAASWPRDMMWSPWQVLNVLLLAWIFLIWLSRRLSSGQPLCPMQIVLLFWLKISSSGYRANNSILYLITRSFVHLTRA